MSNHLNELLKAWQTSSADRQWVLATVYKTEGSAYRKAGSMMLFNSLGQQFGLLSGGCLEADIQRHALKVMQTGEVKLIAYDSRDEADWSAQLGLGCGGKIYIMLQPLTQDNDLDLQKIADTMKQRLPGLYHQKIGEQLAYFEQLEDFNRLDNQQQQVVGNSRWATLESRHDGEWLVTAIEPTNHLLVVGGGVDARPLVSMARILGWHITLLEPRVGNGRACDFPGANHILNRLDETLSDYIQQERVDAVVIMSHNITIDAEALKYCQDSRIQYLALLGPKHRYQQVLDQAGLKEQQLCSPVFTPAGLDIGAQLPESIALSILAECHTILHHKDRSIKLGKPNSADSTPSNLRTFFSNTATIKMEEPA